MQLFDEAGADIQTPHFEYRQNAQGEWEKTPFRLRLVNTGQRSYYCTVLTLSEQYGIETLFDAGVVRLAPGDEAWALGGGWLYPQVPRDRWARDGITETKDVFKLIVSTADFDARILCQDELDPHRPEKELPQRGLGSKTMRGSLHSLLNNLMNRIQWRAVSDRRENASHDDWTTSQLETSTIRPLVRLG